MSHYFCNTTGRTFTFHSTRVLLVAGGYDDGEDDPIAGSEYECEGTVLKQASDDEYPIEVRWDNGHVNQYRSDDLDIVGHIDTMATDNPNKAFRLKKQGDDLDKRNEALDERMATLAVREDDFNKHKKWVKTDAKRHAKAKDGFERLKQVVTSTDLTVEEAKDVLKTAGGNVNTAIEITKLRARQAGLKTDTHRDVYLKLHDSNAPNPEAEDDYAQIAEEDHARYLDGFEYEDELPGGGVARKLMQGAMIKRPDEEQDITEEEAAVIAAKYKAAEERTTKDPITRIVKAVGSKLFGKMRKETREMKALIHPDVSDKKGE